MQTPRASPLVGTTRYDHGLTRGLNWETFGGELNPGYTHFWHSSRTDVHRSYKGARPAATAISELLEISRDGHLNGIHCQFWVMTSAPFTCEAILFVRSTFCARSARGPHDPCPRVQTHGYFTRSAGLVSVRLFHGQVSRIPKQSQYVMKRTTTNTPVTFLAAQQIERSCDTPSVEAHD